MPEQKSHCRRLADTTPQMLSAAVGRLEEDVQAGESAQINMSAVECPELMRSLLQAAAQVAQSQYKETMILAMLAAVLQMGIEVGMNVETRKPQ